MTYFMFHRSPAQFRVNIQAERHFWRWMNDLRSGENMGDFIIICADCKPIGRMEEISIGVLIGKCEICGAASPPVQLNKYRRREFEIARDVQARMMPGPAVLVVDELPEDLR